MSESRRNRPVAYLFGLILLSGTVWFSSKLLDTRPVNAANQAASAGKAEAPRAPGIICFGTVDVEGGIIPLWPTLFPQPGLVKEVLVVEEGKAVKAGEVLVRFESALAEAAVNEARAALDEAKGKLIQARRNAEQAQANHETGIKQQEKAIEARAAELRAAEIGLEQLHKLQQTKPGQVTNDFEIRMMTERVDALAKGLEAERLKLQLIKDSIPVTEPLIQQANAAVNRYQALLDKAEYALKEHVLRAPTDGVILRVNVAAGSTVGPQTKQPLFVFQPAGKLLVRAEIEQEFAGDIHKGQRAQILDDSNPMKRLTWSGSVASVAVSFLPKRSGALLPDPLQFNEPKVLECLIMVDERPEQPLRVGQKVRVKIGVE